MSGFTATDERRKAAKEHKCTTCKLPIPKGTEYHYATGNGDGHWWTWREHPPCRDVTQEWLYDDPDGIDVYGIGVPEVAEAIGNSKADERAAALAYFTALGLTEMVEAIKDQTAVQTA